MSKMWLQFDGVVFDMDGLLLDNGKVYRSAVSEACLLLGFHMSDELHISLVGVPKDVREARLALFFGRTFDVNAFDAACHDAYLLLTKNGIPLHRGALDLIEFLASKDIPMAVATSSERHEAEKCLKQGGIWPFLTALISRSDVTQGKPHPEPFLMAARAIGVDPSKCLALEDSLNGVHSAFAAGLITVMIPDIVPPTKEAHDMCAAILPSLAQLKAMLQQEES